MMSKKRILFALTAVMLIASVCISASAAAVSVVFTDFENVKSFNSGVDIIDLPAVTESEYKDYYAGSYDKSAVAKPATLAIVDGKGVDGSKALEIKQSRGADRANVGVNLYASSANSIPTSIKGTKYLALWVDFTGVEFRKACFGVIGKDRVLYRTDERDGVDGLKFYIQDSKGGWEEMLHGNDDGCFGAAQSSSVADYEGWMAFPIADFAAFNTGKAIFDPETQEIEGVFFYFDYNSETYSDKPFYFDNIQFVADYKALAPASENSEDPKTGDTANSLAIAAVLSMFALGGTVIAVKKYR